MPAARKQIRGPDRDAHRLNLTPGEPSFERHDIGAAGEIQHAVVGVKDSEASAAVHERLRGGWQFELTTWRERERRNDVEDLAAEPPAVHAHEQIRTCRRQPGRFGLFHNPAQTSVRRVDDGKRSQPIRGNQPVAQQTWRA